MPPLKKAHKAMTRWYRGPFRRTEAIYFYYYIRAQQQIPVPYCSMPHIPRTNSPLLAAKQEPYKKAHLLTKNIEELSGKKSGEWTIRQKKKKTERATGLGRRTREEIAKWNQMIALRFQTGGETSDIPGLPLRGACLCMQIGLWENIQVVLVLMCGLFVR